MPYQTIIFDLDGTLRESHPRFMDALHDCLGDMNIHVDGFDWRLTERWVHRYWAQSVELLEDVKQKGEDGVWPLFLARLMRHVGHEPHGEEEIDALVEHLKACYQPISQLMPGAIEALDALHHSGVRMAVVSNRRNPFIEELQNLGIDGYFDFTLAAGEIGHWKPRPEIFEEALRRAGDLSPDDVVYIGDNYYADVVGATGVGIDAILIDDRHIFGDKLVPRIERLDELPDLLNERLHRPALNPQ
ncbi:MAG: HAD family hydrolase [Caldilineales bacterium]|nr:HAD family hydrolase [Caldilineales bacterium]